MFNHIVMSKCAEKFVGKYTNTCQTIVNHFFSIELTPKCEQRHILYDPSIKSLAKFRTWYIKRFPQRIVKVRMQ